MIGSTLLDHIIYVISYHPNQVFDKQSDGHDGGSKNLIDRGNRTLQWRQG